MITSPSNPALDYIDLIPSPGISTPSSIWFRGCAGPV
ncbi:unnamed protein product [Rhodiola kirilowii]